MLPDAVRRVIEKNGFVLPRRATFADGLAAMLFAKALQGNPAAARVIYDVIEGTSRVVIDENRVFGPGAVQDALNKIRELYGLEKIIDAVPIPASDVQVLPAPEDQATATASEPDAVSIGGTGTEAEASLGRAGDGAAAGG